MCTCLARPDVEQHLRCRKLRAWVVRWVADDANYARMVRYDVYHKLRRLRGFVSALSRPLLVTSAAGSPGA